MTHVVTNGGAARAPRAGGLLRRWRVARGLSQMRLALDAHVSARHVSFIESGRSEPGRGVLIRLGRALNLSHRELNRILEVGGFAPLHPPRRFGDPDLAAVREVLQFLLDRHEPNSAVVVDRASNVLLHNRPHAVTMRIFAPRSRTAHGMPANLLEEVFDPEALRPAIENFDLVGHVLRARVERACIEFPSLPELSGLLKRIDGFGPLPEPVDLDALARQSLLLPIKLRRGGHRLNVVSTVTHFAAPLDATVQELQLETFFPADAPSERFVRAIAEQRVQAD